jgi:hypothetical protein
LSDTFFWLVVEQLPPRLRPLVDVKVKSDPYHIKTIAVFTDKALPERTYECELEIIRPEDARSLALKIPDLALAHICVFFG